MLVGVSPLANRSLETRSDIESALVALWEPLRRRFSPGRARVKIGSTGANYSDVAAELEGFARPLWGLVPLAAGGMQFDDWDLYREGLTNGTDPEHPEYWGAAVALDQRFVEMAAIGLGLALVPNELWNPLSGNAKTNLVSWLSAINDAPVHDDNWYFFRVLVNMGLRNVGQPWDPVATEKSLVRLEEFYLDDGWYADGPLPQLDYYIAWAMHFYGLIYARLNGHEDRARAERFRERASIFAKDFAHWFAADGGALPHGRSLTYRFAQGSFWGALPFANVEAMPWGEVKGFWLRNLRWWASRQVTNGDGTLSIGYSYPNLNMAEGYNSPGSPYWAFKTFLPLALPSTHPFWLAEEMPLPEMEPVRPLRHAGMIVCRDRSDDHVFALTSGQHAHWMRHGGAKYSKLAYSTHFGFSVPGGQWGFNEGAYDSALALSEDGIHFRTREEASATEFRGDYLWSRWQPWPDVEVETWVCGAPPWHIRVHKIRSKRRLMTVEGGWSVNAATEDSVVWAERIERGGEAIAVYPGGWSGIKDFAGNRVGNIVDPLPNTNLMFPRTVLPTLSGEYEPGEFWIACAVVGKSNIRIWEDVWALAPRAPTQDELEAAQVFLR